MINYIFSNKKKSVGVSPCADNGVIWKRGRNIGCIKAKLQEALHKVESWASELGFRLSLSKTRGIIFTVQIERH